MFIREGGTVGLIGLVLAAELLMLSLSSRHTASAGEGDGNLRGITVNDSDLARSGPLLSAREERRGAYDTTHSALMPTHCVQGFCSSHLMRSRRQRSHDLVAFCRLAKG